MNLLTFIEDHWLPAFESRVVHQWYKKVKQYHIPFVLMISQDPFANIDTITKKDAAEWWRKLRGIKNPGLTNKLLTTAKSIFRYAVELDMIPESPVYYLKRTKGNMPRVRYLTDDELSRILQCASESIKMYVRVACYTGARRRSLRDLKWEHVDWDRNIIRFVKTKAGHDVEVPIHPELRVFLVSWETLSGQERYVLPRLQINTISTGFKRAVTKAGLEDFRFHDLRHDFASRLINNGVPLPVVGRMLGHRTLQSTSRYAHVNMNTLRQAIEKI